MKIKLTIITIFLIFTSLGCTKSKNEFSYKVKGPKALIKVIKKVLPDFLKQYPHLKLTLEAVEDARAIASYLDGTCDFALASRLFNVAENNYAERKDKQVQAYPITRDAVSVIVSPKNPVENIRYETLKQILSYKVIEWKNIIEEESRRLRTNPVKFRDFIQKSREIFPLEIKICLLNNLYSMYEYLLNRINIKYFSTKIQFFKTPELLKKFVEKNETALGVISSSSPLKGCKVLTLNSIKITRNNIINKQYPMNMTYYLFIPLDYKEIEMIDFVFFLRSKKVRNELRKQGFVRP